MPSKFLSFKRIIVICVITFTVIMGGFTAFILILQDNLKQNMNLFLQETAKQSATTVNTRIIQIFTSLESLEKSFGFENELDRQALDKVINTVTFDHESSQLFYFDTNGNAFASNDFEFNVKNREYFTTIMGGQSAVKDMSISRITGEYSIAFSVPIKSKSGDVLGGLAVTYPVVTIAEFLGTDSEFAIGKKLICEDDGTIIYHPDLTDIGKNIIEVGAFSSEKQNIEDIFNFSDINKDDTPEIIYEGKKYLSKVHPIEYNNWQVISIIESDHILGRFTVLIWISFYVLAGILTFLASVFIYLAVVSKRTANHIMKSNEKLQAYISNVPGGVFKLNINNLHMFDLSAGLYRLFDMKREDFYDKFFNRFENIICESDKNLVVEEIRLQNQECELEFRIVNRLNEERLLYFKGSLLIEDETPFYYAILNDVTDIRRVYQDIISYRTSLSALTDSIPGGVATFIFNSDLTLFNINDGFFSLVGYSRELFEALFENKLVNFLNQEQAKELIASIDSQILDNITIENEFSIVNKMGHEVWLLMRGSRTDDINEYPAYQAIFIDVTQQKRINQELETERERFRLMATFTTVALFEYDVINDRIMNFYTTKNSTSNSLIEKLEYDNLSDFKNRIYAKDISAFEYICESLRNGTDSFTSEIRIKNYSGEYFWASVEGKAIYDSQGNSTRIVGRITNIDQQKKSTQNLLYSAQRDALTGLYNKKITKSEIEQFLAIDNGEFKSALMIIDVDNFKEVNDNFGHMFGDSVLKSVTSKLKKIFRNHDVIGRIGGDEFLVFMKNIPTDAILHKKAELICEAFNTTYKSDNIKTTISSSIGISVFPKDGKTYNELFEKADKSLYKSKLEGKNKYSIYDDNYIYKRDANALKRDDVPNKIDINFTDNTIVSDLVSALYSSNSPEENLNVAMAIVAGYYDSDDVSLFEITNDNRLKLVYSMVDGVKQPFENKNHEFSEGYKYLFDSKGFFYCSDIDVLEENSPQVYREVKSKGLKSFLQALISNNDTFAGMLMIANRRQVAYWSTAQCSTMVVLAKILGSYFSKVETDMNNFKTANIDPFTKTWNVSRLIVEANNMIPTTDKDFCIVYFNFINENGSGGNLAQISDEKIFIKIRDKISASLENGEMYSHTEGSGFVLLINFISEERIHFRFEEFKKSLLSVWKKYNENHVISLRAGASTLDKDEKSINTAISRANKAKNVARETQSDEIVFYSKELQEFIDIQSRLEESMLIALQNGEFEAYYQPKVRISDGKIVGAEALARWKRDGSIFYPKDFLAVFEKYSFIEQLDYFIIEKVCKKLYQDNKDEKTVLPISVNISAATLMAGDFAENVIAILEENGVSQGLIEFEINEDAFMKHPVKLIEVIKNLKATGLQFVLDNYASNYSVMNIMDTFNVNVLKISGEYLKKAIDSSQKKYILKDLISMARKFGITVVADNVETAEMLDFAEEVGCDLIQGYPHGKPMSMEEFNNIIYT